MYVKSVTTNGKTTSAAAIALNVRAHWFNILLMKKASVPRPVRRKGR